MPGNYPATLRAVMNARGNWQEVPQDDAIEQCNFVFRPVNYGYQGYDKINNRLKNSNEPFIYNHFEVLKGICTKTGLIRSLNHYYENNKEATAAYYTTFDTTPTTFLVSLATDDNGINRFTNRFKEISKGVCRKERVPVKHCEQNIWLIKPANANQGRGIEIFRSLRDIQ